MNFYYRKIKTPVGVLHLVSDEKKLQITAFSKHWQSLKKLFPKLNLKRSPILDLAETEIREYLKGKLLKFSVPVEFQGTEFQKRVWTSLRKIQYGETISYKQQAERIHQPNAVRAVARANGMNPLCIIIPCHRVIGSSGSLTGYAGGIAAKQLLLKLESENFTKTV